MVSELDCGRAIELETDRSSGRVISVEDARALAEHIEGCRDCNLVLSVLAEGSTRDNSGALPVLDELSRRRVIDSILESAERAIVSVPPAHRSFPSRRALLVGASVAALVVAWMAVAVFKGSTDEATVTANGTRGSQLPTAHAVEARVMLVSGDVDVAGAPAQLGDLLSPGVLIATGEGRAVVGVADDIGVAIGSGARVRIDVDGAGIPQIELDRGSVQISVRPGKEGARLQVRTADGTVEVTGTVFSVATGAAGSVVRVLRGKVRVDLRDGVKRLLVAGQWMSFSDGRAETLPPDDEQEMWGTVRVLDLLDPLVDHARIDVNSSPPGAEFALDGIVVGLTPINASIRAGHRHFALLVDREEVLNESVSVDHGENITRFYNLAKSTPSVPGADGDSIRAGKMEISPSGSRGDASVSAGLGSRTSELLAQARSLRAAGDWTGAERAYLALIRDHLEAAEVRASMVALGEIQLSKLGKAAEAMEQFDRYLRIVPSGHLAQEALYGKIQALRALGRLEAEREVLQSFVTRFPGAIQVPEAKRRLAELEVLLNRGPVEK